MKSWVTLFPVVSVPICCRFPAATLSTVVFFWVSLSLSLSLGAKAGEKLFYVHSMLGFIVLDPLHSHTICNHPFLFPTLEEILLARHSYLFISPSSLFFVHLVLQMGLFYCTIIPRKQSLQLFPILLFFFLAMYSAQGRSLSKLQEIVKEKTKEEMVMVEGMIGSRPPRCERRCLSCGHCEAVQVPIALHSQNGTRQSSKTITSKDDDDDDRDNDHDDGSPKYKLLNWKCKCGGMILNP